MPRRSQETDGFTLIELVVVIALISIMFTVAIPRIGGGPLADGLRTACQRLVTSIPDIRDRAVREQEDYHLNINIDTNLFWVTRNGMTEDEVEAAESKGYQLPGGVDILGVEYPDTGRLESGRTFIRFYKKGYSDKAQIHLRDEDDEKRSLLIEPFLRRVQLSDL